MGTYMICDSDGYAMADGLQEREAREIAQGIATRRGESVWLVPSGSDEDGEEIKPEEDQRVITNIAKAKLRGGSTAR
jgi:hypothetical protein